MTGSRPSRSSHLAGPALIAFVLSTCVMGKCIATSTCAALISRADAAMGGGNFFEARKALEDADHTYDCPEGTLLAARARGAELLYRKLNADALDPTDARLIERIADIVAFAPIWRAEVLLGDHYRVIGRPKEALAAYLKAREAAGNDILSHADCPASTVRACVSQPMMDAIVSRYNSTVSLETANGRYVPDGHEYARLVELGSKGAKIVPTTITVPFIFNEDTPTTAGETLIKSLIEAILELAPPSVQLVGHTDMVGSDEYNLALSRKRAAFVGARLKAAGYAGIIRTDGKGKREPPKDAAKDLSAADYAQLCRRVVWILKDDED